MAELASLDRLLLGGRLGQPALAAIGGRCYYRLESSPLDAQALGVIARLSTVYAAFELREGALVPLELPRVELLPDDLVTVQRYQGKTNEHLTRLMTNVALAAAGAGPGARCAVFDPVCGRGTTLNQALLYGMDAFGMEIERTAVEAYAHFLGTWLRNHRLKHRISHRAQRRDRRVVAHVLEAAFSDSREELERGRPQRVRVVAADSAAAADHFEPAAADALVADLPYGVQHAGRGAGGRAERGPLALLTSALPAWRRVLRPGAGVCLAWNTRALDRDRLAQLVAGAGFEVLDGAPFTGFAHAVDSAIRRDLLLAVAGRPQE